MICVIHSLVTADADCICLLGASLKRGTGPEKVLFLACSLVLLPGKQRISLPSAAFAYALVPLLGIGLSEDLKDTLKTCFHSFEV